MIEIGSKLFFNLLARSRVLKKLAAQYGMRNPSSFARRFVAGESIVEAIEAARQVEAEGLCQTLDYLGEGITTLAGAEKATKDYLQIVDAILQSNIDRNLSIKLTQLGLDVDRATAVDNIRRILDRAKGFFIRIDMESSAYTDVTLDIFETLWQQEYRQIGVVLQADLYRTEKDIRRIMALGARIRLVKGAYVESKSVAYPRKADVDAAYIRLMDLLLREGCYPAIATHDPAIIDRAKQLAAIHEVAPGGFEFQMLYGIRRDLQATLVKEGFLVRLYIPFGRQWFPYFMRRLGERPANVWFVGRSMLSER